MRQPMQDMRSIVGIMPILLSAVFVLLGSTALYATHNRAGEITFVQMGPLSIRCTITTYTKASSVAADRDSLLIVWGDGTSEYVRRINGPNGKGELIGNNIKYNLYIAEHRYPSRGQYTISTFDPNRISNIINIPSSVDVPFYIETTLTLLDPVYQGYNNSAILLQPPIDIGCLHQPFIHIPNAYDPDGDSLAFELIVPYQAENTPVSGYAFPDEILPGPANSIHFDQQTGTFLWNSPQLEGEYNIAIRIKEYRNGILITSVVRDMQIFIAECERNSPPQIEVPADTCVIAGTTLHYRIIASDPADPQQKLLLTALGSPFSQSISPAQFAAPAFHAPQPVEGNFIWQTDCHHISQRYYSVVFKATDDYFADGQQYDDTTGLSTLKLWRIKVVGPPPQIQSCTYSPSGVRLQWDYPALCDTATNYFLGFHIWRASQPVYLQADTCNSPNLETSYRLIRYFYTGRSDGHYVFYDTTVDQRKTYCYRITAVFGRRTASGTPYNITQSLPSEECCISTGLDLPFILNVDVRHTDADTGSIFVRFLTPSTDAIDTTRLHGPYTFTLLAKTPGTTTPEELFSWTIPSFDTSMVLYYLHRTINTRDSVYEYTIEMYTTAQQASSYYGRSEWASSVYGHAQPLNRAVRLQAEATVPWKNFLYTYFRWNPLTAQWDSLGSSSYPSWVDTPLTNDSTYCYVIRSTGTYGLNQLPTPLINHSQVFCARPHDNVPPCPPILNISNICTDVNYGEDRYSNTLTWSLPVGCPPEDGMIFQLFHRSFADDSFRLLHISPADGDNHFIHTLDKSIGGCYFIRAVDSLGNPSAVDDTVCVYDCVKYVLPNTFTPNDDGYNDVFRPRVIQFVKSVDFRIYNEWGQLIWKTTDPNINWTGVDLNDNPVSDGVYYYTCQVVPYVELSVPSDSLHLKGFIHVIHNRQ